MLAAHFDSKYFKEFDFIAATDSAIPCGILLDIAQSLNTLLDTLKDPKTTIQLIFFDGEEAFVDWSATDSLYGSRHLAAKWANTYVSPQQAAVSGPAIPSSPKSVLTTIDAFVLLDLLGAPGSIVYNMNQDTVWMWDRITSIENRLYEEELLSERSVYRADEQGFAHFAPNDVRPLQASIQDDHIPFQQRGVPIVHVIPQPFPRVWHTKADDASAVDPHTVSDLALIFKALVLEYLGIKLQS